MKPAFLSILTLIAAFLMLAPAARAEINSSGVLGFQAWKAARVDDAKQHLEKLEGQGVDPKKGPQEPARRRLQQAQLNLEIIQELNITDYFTLYVTQLKDRSSFLDAAKKLSTDETADLMMAYQKTLMADAPGSNQPESKPTPQGPTTSR